MDQLLCFKQISLGVQVRVDQLLQAISDLKKHAFPKLPRILENPGELALRLAHKVIKGPDDGCIQVPDQNLDQRISQHHLAGLTHLLAHQKQHRPQGHPRCRHARRNGHHPDQVDAQTHPIQRIALLIGRQPNDVIQRIDQRHDVAHHRQPAGHGLDPLKRDNPATDLLQPCIDIGRTKTNVFNLNKVKRNNRHLRFVVLTTNGQI